MRLAIALFATALCAYAQCEPALPVREAVEDAWAATAGLPYTQSQARQREMYLHALKQHPRDYFLLCAALRAMDDGDAALEWVRGLRASGQDAPVYDLIHALVLEGRDTPEALRTVRAVIAKHPGLVRARLVLADMMAWGNFHDDAGAKEELSAFLKACPAPLDAAPLRTVGRIGTKEQMSATAAAVRTRLKEVPDRLAAGLYAELWKLEFKATPPADHASVRKRMRQDLATFEAVQDSGRLRWLVFLRDGYNDAGVPARATELMKEIVAKYPRSEPAKEEVQKRWRAEHPAPSTADEAKIEAWARAKAAQWAEWHKLWPDDSSLYHEWLAAVLEVPDSPPDRIARMGGELMRLYRADPSWFSSKPVEYQVAEAFVGHRVNLAIVPKLLEEGEASSEKHAKENLGDDRAPEQFSAVVRQAALSRRVERHRIQVAYYAATNDKQGLRRVDAELTEMQTTDAQTRSKILLARAAAAEALGIKSVAPVEIKTAPSERWEKPARPIPHFRLSDLNGRSWTLEGLRGKAVLINIWATWCGPCRMELEPFQQLYNDLKDRPGFALITFNVDDDIGKVAPFVEQNKYTFPVLFAREVLDAVSPGDAAIPQNWFLDRHGNLIAIQVGYQGSPQWRDAILGKLAEVAKLPQQP